MRPIGIRNSVFLLVGVLLFAWGCARLIAAGAPFGFANMRLATADLKGIEIENVFVATVGFDSPFSEGDVVNFFVPVKERVGETCVDFYLKSDYYRPGSPAARNVFDFRIVAPGVAIIEYEISEEEGYAYFRIGPLDKKADTLGVQFVLTATKSYESESFQRASRVKIESVRSTLCDS